VRPFSVCTCSVALDTTILAHRADTVRVHTCCADQPLRADVATMCKDQPAEYEKKVRETVAQFAK
jgi:hypothetical protein